MSEGRKFFDGIDKGNLKSLWDKWVSSGHSTGYSPLNEFSTGVLDIYGYKQEILSQGKDLVIEAGVVKILKETTDFGENGFNIFLNKLEELAETTKNSVVRREILPKRPAQVVTEKISLVTPCQKDQETGVEVTFPETEEEEEALLF